MPQSAAETSRHGLGEYVEGQGGSPRPALLNVESATPATQSYPASELKVTRENEANHLMCRLVDQ
jgi:hypothetical protein